MTCHLTFREDSVRDQRRTGTIALNAFGRREASDQGAAASRDSRNGCAAPHRGDYSVAIREPRSLKLYSTVEYEATAVIGCRWTMISKALLSLCGPQLAGLFALVAFRSRFQHV